MRRETGGRWETRRESTGSAAGPAGAGEVEEDGTAADDADGAAGCLPSGAAPSAAGNRTVTGSAGRTGSSSSKTKPGTSLGRRISGKMASRVSSSIKRASSSSGVAMIRHSVAQHATKVSHYSSGPRAG